MEQCWLGRAGVSTVEILRRGQSRAGRGQQARQPFGAPPPGLPEAWPPVGPLCSPAPGAPSPPVSHLPRPAWVGLSEGQAARRAGEGQVGEQVLGGLEEGR